MSLSWRLALLYGVLFAGPGIAMPFLPVFLSARELSPEAVALALGVAQAARLLAGPAGGRLADRIGRRRPVIVGCAVLAAAGALLLLPGHGFMALACALAVHGSGSAPLTPLVDTVALAAKVDFGRVRALGSVTFIAGTFLGAWATGALGPESLPVLLALPLLATALVGGTLPRDQAVAERTPGLAFALLRRPGFALLVVASGLVQGSHAAFYALSTLHWRAAGLSDAAVGALWSIGVAAEILLLFFARHLLLRLPPPRLAALAAAAAILRWLGTAATTGFVPLLALQALHALSFAGMLLAALAMVQRLVPAEAAATGQALQAALGPGLFMLALTFLCGPLYAAFGGLVFLAMALAAALGLFVVLLLAARLPELRRPVPGGATRRD
jgi:PPP family 3-phenylpropionic acid transporter